MPELSSDGARIRFEVSGPPGAPALLLAHALGTSAALWAPQVAPLEREFRVIRYDARGHGRSTASPAPYTLEQLGRDALAVLDAAGARRAHVCGVSLGGQVALWLGAHAPDRVIRLVPANTGARIGDAGQWNARIAALRELGVESFADGVVSRWFTPAFREADPATVAALRATMLATPVEGYAGCCAAVRDADLVPALPSIAAPTLVVAGAQDEATPPALSERIRDAIPGARLATLDAAHLANVECAAAFTALLADFLGG